MVTLVPVKIEQLSKKDDDPREVSNNKNLKNAPEFAQINCRLLAFLCFQDTS